MHELDQQYDIFQLEYSEYGEYDDDRLAIQIAINVARRLLQEPKITASQIVGIRHALYALQRLPVVTPGANVRFGVVVYTKTEFANRENPEEPHTYTDMDYIDFCISFEAFEIARGGSTDTGLGRDSFSLSGWYVGLNGARETICELGWIEEGISMLLEQENTEISVEDHSDIDFFCDEELLPLNYHPLNQKAKELLQQTAYNLLKKQLYILQLMTFALKDPQLSDTREEIRNKDFIDELEKQVKILRHDIAPEQTMNCLIKSNYLSIVLNADNLIKGATAALGLVSDIILNAEYEGV